MQSNNTVLRRQRISQACKQCGSRKVKCDGNTPTCGRCSADSVQCVYGISRRNKRLFPRVSHDISMLGMTSSSTPACGETSNPELFPPRHDSSCTEVYNYNTLFQSYFRYIHPVWPILYQPIYNTMDYIQLKETLPRPLCYAILSIAVLIDAAEHRAESKQEHALRFFKQALKLLEDPISTEDDQSLLDLKSSVVHCQVLTILALQQHSIGRFSQAGIICATAGAMAIDLSLHRISESDDHVEAQIKSRIWWNIYVLEKMLSCEMNRPVLFRAEEAETPFPSVEASDEYDFFMSNHLAGELVGNTRQQLLRLRTISAFHSSVKIAMIMEKISRQVYSTSARQLMRSDRQKREEIRLQLSAELHEYEQMMESSNLKLDTSETLASVPVVVTNYIYMWSTTILLHRPFIENWQFDDTEVQNSGQNPYDTCVLCASKICSTIDSYTRYIRVLPCDLIFPIFVAAVILLRHWRQVGSEDPLIRPQLELCLKWLNGMGKNWGSAENRHQMLAESINVASQNELMPAEQYPPAWAPCGTMAEIPFDDPSNFTLLPMEDEFNLDYVQWVDSLNIY